MEFKEQRINQGQGSLRVRDYAGAEPAYIALHGFPDNLHIYDEWAPLVAKGGSRVITIDFLGFGESDKAPEFLYSFDQQLTDLEAVVNSLSLDHVILVGHDAGGTTAINFALKHPDKTAGVCLFNCFYGSAPSLKLPELIELFATSSLSAVARAILNEPKQMAWLLNFQREQFKLELSTAQAAHFDKFLMPIIVENFMQTPSAGLAFARMTAGLMDEIARNDERLVSLKELNIPFLLVWGNRDPYLNLGVAQDLVSKLQNAQLVAVEAGHWPQIDEPEQVTRATLAFFR